MSRVTFTRFFILVAIVQALAGLMYGFFYGPDLAWLEWVFVLSSPAYLLLALLSKRHPGVSISLGIVSYAHLGLYIDFQHERMGLLDGRLLALLNFLMLSFIGLTFLRKKVTP